MVNVGDWRSTVEGLVRREESGASGRDIECFALRLGRGRGIESGGGASAGRGGDADGCLTGPELIDRIAALERLKAAAAAEQARAEVAFAELCEAGADPSAASLEGKT